MYNQVYKIASLNSVNNNFLLDLLLNNSEKRNFQIIPYSEFSGSNESITYDQNNSFQIPPPAKKREQLVNLVTESINDRSFDAFIIPYTLVPYPLPKQLEVLAVIKDKTNPNILKNHHLDLMVVVSAPGHSELKEKLQNFDLRKKLGTVYLVGTGQNDPELITLKADRLIRKADIIFYDSLINPEIMSKSGAKKVFVGKRASMHFKEQNEINVLLYEAALNNKCVVRIKGGDPMIYGHAGEEIAFLESRFINVQILPGITSALGASARTTIPLTLRNISRNVSFCTAHQKDKVPVPDTDTIVYFMGTKNLHNIAVELIRSNRPPSTPVKIIYNIGAEDEEQFNETLESLLTGKREYKPPLIIIVGEVTDKNNWHKAFIDMPKILYTGSHLKKYSHLGQVVHVPLIEITPLGDYSELTEHIENIGKYDWIVFTSAHSARYFFTHLFKHNKDIRTLNSVKIASIGHFTSEKLKEFGILPDLQPENESSEGLVEMFSKENITGKNILLPRSNMAPGKLPDGLKKSGNNVFPVVVYENKLPDNIENVNPEDFDQIILTSPSGVKNFLKVFGKFPDKPTMVAKGNETKNELRKQGYLK